MSLSSCHVIRNYPISFGGTALSFSGGSGTYSLRPKWVIVGQECGGVSRGLTARFLTAVSAPLTVDSFKAAPAVDDVYASIHKGDENFHHDAHIGAVNSLDCSPFHR